ALPGTGDWTHWPGTSVRPARSKTPLPGRSGSDGAKLRCQLDLRYASRTVAGIRPRSETTYPFFAAQSRICFASFPAPVPRFARPPTRRADVVHFMKSERISDAFSSFRSIS